MVLKKLVWAGSGKKGGNAIKCVEESSKETYGHQPAGEYERLQRNEVTIIAERD